ncbi:putative ABC transporter permease [Evtepia sp.]|uniref:putative ABC transporter permease n=1 Tax=Evtepia sp. TaxID=2773933 RepID=UPI003F179985
MVSVFLQFILYSFLGFLLEVAYAWLRGIRGQGRKCLIFLPLCPVYGLGAAAILNMPDLLLGHPLSVFVAGGLLATLVEYAVGLFYEVAAGVRFWDYSQQPGNLGGRICPLFTLFWGVLAIALVEWIHPALAPLLAQVPLWLVWVLFLVFSVDGILSLCLLHETGTTESLCWYRTRRQPGESV